MIAQSVGLEIYVGIYESEFKELSARPINGLLNFLDVKIPFKRNIPLTFQYSPEQIELLVIEQEPKDVYFGRADSLKFSINPEFYGILSENKRFGQRFGRFGRLEIMINAGQPPQTL